MNGLINQVRGIRLRDMAFPNKMGFADFVILCYTHRSRLLFAVYDLQTLTDGGEVAVGVE